MIVRQCPWRARRLQQLWRPLSIKNLHGERATREDQRWPGWEVVVGIEVHAQIKSRRKLFSGAYQGLSGHSGRDVLHADALTSKPGETPNAFVACYDAALPGTLPVRHLVLSVARVSYRHTDVEPQLRRARRPNCDRARRTRSVALRVRQETLLLF
jgi:hypothetical protein